MFDNSNSLGLPNQLEKNVSNTFRNPNLLQKNVWFKLKSLLFSFKHEIKLKQLIFQFVA